MVSCSIKRTQKWHWSSRGIFLFTSLKNNRKTIRIKCSSALWSHFKRRDHEAVASSGRRIYSRFLVTSFCSHGSSRYGRFGKCIEIREISRAGSLRPWRSYFKVWNLKLTNPSCVSNVNQAVADVIWVTPKVYSQTMKMELDAGSAVSTLPVQKYKEMFPNTPLVATEAILKPA